MANKKKSQFNDVQSARGRLKGALQEIVSPTDDDNEFVRKRIKRPRIEESVQSQAPPVQQTFIMKLFDRSVDLAKYREHTALYPICRAWMYNQPRSNKIVNFRVRRSVSPDKREPMDDIEENMTTGKVTEINQMPAPNKHTRIPVKPSLIPSQQNSNKHDIDLNYDVDNPPVGRDELLISLKKRWSDIRLHHQQHRQRYCEEKYGKSNRVLEKLFFKI